MLLISCFDVYQLSTGKLVRDGDKRINQSGSLSLSIVSWEKKLADVSLTKKKEKKEKRTFQDFTYLEASITKRKLDQHSRGKFLISRANKIVRIYTKRI